MTTYQDQPLSRREIREREAEAARAAEAAGTAVPGSGFPGNRDAAPASPTAEPLNYLTQGRTPLPQYDASGAPHSEPPVSTEEAEAGYRVRDFSPDGRRAARLGWSPTAEPADLDYRTQNRDDVPPAPFAPGPFGSASPVVPEVPIASTSVSPHESTMSRRELRAMREAQGLEPVADDGPVSPSESIEQASPATGETPAWLAAFTPPAGGATPVAAASAPPAFDDLLGPPAGVPEPVAPQPFDAPALPAPSFDLSGPPVVPPPLVEPAEPQTDAMASLEALFRAQTGANTLPTGPAPTLADSPAPAVEQEPPAAADPFPVWQIGGDAVPAAAPVAEPEPVAPAPAAAASVDQPTLPPWGGLAPGQTSAPPSTAVSAPPVVPVADFAAFPPPILLPESPSAAPVAEPGPRASEDAAPVVDGTGVDGSAGDGTGAHPLAPGERPRNHWSRQEELDDEAQPSTGSIARDVGAGSATANALVLPEIPNQDFIVSSVTSTGDVLVTGTISLPASLASTGALPAQIDEADLDNMLDPGDAQVASTDSQPVRAIRAVSTHTSSREIIGTITPKRSSRALTVLIAAAAGMAVVVVTLLVVALVSGVLG